MREYDRIAGWFAATRSAEVGIPSLTDLTRSLAPGARVLDLGCGHGVPLSQHLARSGFRVLGLDSAPEMIRRYRVNVPGATAQCERAQEARFPARSFAAVVAWGVLFHLSEQDQVALIARVSEWLEPGGQFLFMSGAEEGEASGEMNGVRFDYVSLGAERYRRAIERAGMSLASHHRDAWDNDVYLSQKPAQFKKPLAPEAAVYSRATASPSATPTASAARSRHEKSGL